MDPFLAAVCAEPDDDLPRLVWADWLEDRGDPRGEFVRLQMAEHLGEPGNPARVEELIRTHGRKWAGPLADWAYSITWHRGCPDHLVIPAEVFLDLASAIFEAAPVRGVTLIGAARLMREVARLPELAKLRRLHLTGGRVGDSGVARLTQSENVTALTHLRLGGCAVTSDGVADLASGRWWHNLESLDLSHNIIDDWGARALAASSALPRLRHVDVSGNDLSPAVIEKFGRFHSWKLGVERCREAIPRSAKAG